MVEFMKKLQERMHPAWKHAYLNYKLMKKQLKIMGAFTQEDSQGGNITWLKLLFQRTLDSEISKMLDFYRFQAHDLGETVDKLNNKDRNTLLSILNQHDVSSAVKIYLLNEYQGKWRTAATKLVRLLDYVSLNMQALRKTVKKQHKVVGTLQPNADESLRATLIIQHPHEPINYEQGSFLSPEDVQSLASMDQHQELLHIKAIIQQRLAQVAASIQQFESAPSAVHRERVARSSVSTAGGGRVSIDQPPSSTGSPSHFRGPGSFAAPSSVVVAAEEDVETHAIAERTRMLVALPSLSERSPSERSQSYKQRLGKSLGQLSTPVPVQWPSIALDDGLMFTTGHDEDQDALVQSIVRATEELKRNAKLISPHSNNLGFAAAIFEPAPLKSRGTTLGITVQLVTTFLYMANYNLVIPTVDNYMVHLKVPSTTGGLMIGCADGSAIAIAVLYSAWTNRSYRQPTLAAAVLCCIGNLLVTVAYDTGGLPLLLVGRLVTGAGNARMISRRYMADFFSKDDRDRVSMLFVAASALGMAFGPFITWPLSLVLPRADEGDKVFGFSVNIITVGGWLMVLMWVAFYLFAYLMFDEPVDTAGGRGEDDETTAPPAPAIDFSDTTATPAQSTDNFAPAATPNKKPYSLNAAGDKLHVDSLGSSRLLNPPPWQKFAESEEDITMPLLAEAFPQPSALAPNKRSSAEGSALLPATPSEQQPSESSPFAGTAVNVSGFQDAAAAESIDSNYDPIHAPFTTEAEACAGAVSFLSRGLPPAPGESCIAAMWTGVVGAVRSVYFLPTVTCSMMLFLLKLLQQTTVSAVPVFTGDFYGWHERDVSLFMTALSLAMFFVTIAATLGNGLVGRRVMIGASLFFCGCGCVLMIEVGDEPISLSRYLTSLSIILAFTNILEGVTMSVMGDVIHPLMAAGFWNAGLMATQSGSIGRLFGNFSITVFGSWAETTIILGNEMYLCLAFCVALCGLLFMASYPRMQKLN